LGQPKDSITEANPNVVREHRDAAPEKAEGKELDTGETKDVNAGDSIGGNRNKGKHVVWLKMLF
jgi:hypothetical protein